MCLYLRITEALGHLGPQHVACHCQINRSFHKGPCGSSGPRLHAAVQACNGTWLFWGNAQLLSASPVTLSIHTHDTSTSRWVLCVCVCVCACQRHVPTHCPIFSAHAQMISLISSSVSSHPFLSSFLFFFSLTGSVYDPFLNTSPFPQGGHCHLSRLTTSPTFPLRYLSLFLRPLPRSLIDDISHRHLLGDLYRPFSARPLNGGCVPPFRQSVQLIGGIKLTNCHHIL